MLTNDAVPIMVKVMAPYVGDTMARSATEAHCQRLGVAGGSIEPEQVDILLAKLGAGLNVFLGKDKSATVIAEVRAALAAEGKR
jgi:hypothetical protein